MERSDENIGNQVASIGKLRRAIARRAHDAFRIAWLLLPIFALCVTLRMEDNRLRRTQQGS